MFRIFIKSLIFLLVLHFLMGCAASFYSQGRKNLEKEDYDAAVEAFELALRERPNDARILREMGITFYRKGEFSKAIQYLLEAFKQDQKDGQTLFYLGVAFETTDKIRYAITLYQRYINVSPAGDLRSQIEGRLTRLFRQQMAAEARAVLEQEAAIDAASITDNTVGVLYFRNMGNKRGLDPLQKGMADMLITDLSKVKSLKVIERIRMQKLFEEMGLGSTGLVDEATAPRIGKLLGAATLINGTFLDLTEYGFRVDAGLVRTKERTIQTDYVEGKLLRLFQLEKDLIFRIVDRMGIELTQEERDEIEIIPTENILAFMAYCRGLDYEDKGMFERASQEYQKAVELDPDFRKAQNNLNQSKSLSTVPMKVAQLEEVYAEKSTPRTTQQSQPKSAVSPADNVQPRRPAVSVTDHMIRIGSVLNQAFLPGIDSRKPAQEQADSGFGNMARIKIHILLPVQ